MNKIKLGIIGLGSHYLKGHHTFILNDDRCAITQVYDINHNRCKKIAEDLQNINICNSESELISSDIDAIYIMTPDAFHAKNSYDALKAEKHVFCEKPLADTKTNLVWLERALHVAKEKKLIFSSCHPRRFDLPFMWLKNRLPNLIENYGSIISFDFDFSYRKPPDKILHEGLLMDHFNHEIDLMNFLFGYSKFHVFKLNDSQIKYRIAGQRLDGISFTFGGTRMLEAAIYAEICRIKLEKADIILNAQTGNCHINEYGREFLERCGETDYVSRFKDVNDNFISSILGKNENYLSDFDLKINTESGIYLHLHDFYRSV